MGQSPPSHWIQTFSGKAFYFPPTVDMVDKIDIAHSLSMQCRYNGHCLRFHSVAEHCVMVSRWLEKKRWLDKNHPELALAGLLHDASEAYVCDVPRPIKPLLKGYNDLESQVQEVICQKFGITMEELEHPLVKEADFRILIDEKAVNMADEPAPWSLHPSGPLGIELQYWSPAEAKARWLQRLERLMG